MRIVWVLLALFACGGPTARLLSGNPTADAGAAGAGVDSSVDAGVIAAGDAGVIAAGDAGVIAAGDAGVPERRPSLAGCPVFPLGNGWTRDISSEPVAPHS